MSSISTEQKAKSQDRKALNNFSQDILFDFLHGERIRKVLERTYSLALEEDPHISIPLLKYLLEGFQYFPNEGRRTNELCLTYSIMNELNSSNDKMVETVGFEPTSKSKV